MAAGLPVPKRVYANGWWTVEGEKMSKSVGNVIDPRDLVAEFGLDVLRYFLLREMPFGNDGDFNRRALIGRMNSELANDLGNLAQRSLSLIAKNCGGLLPERAAPTEDDAELLAQAAALPRGDAAQAAAPGLWRGVGRSLARDPGGQRLYRPPSPVGVAPHRPSSDGGRAARAGGRDAPGGDRAAALHARQYDGDAGPAWRPARGPSNFAALAQPLPGGVALPPPQGIFPRFVEAA